MKGYPESNYPLFHETARRLRAIGHHVYNPAEFAPGADPFPIREAFADYSRFICLEACTIYLLPGYERSLWAGAELALARNCGLDVLYHETFWQAADDLFAAEERERQVRDFDAVFGGPSA